METLNQKRDSWIAWIFFISILIVASTLMVGCGGDKKGNRGTTATAPGYGGNYYPDCGQCSSYSQQILTAANASMDNGVDLAMALFSPGGANVGPNPGPYGGGNGIGYTGPVGVAGYLEVFNSPVAECPFAPGFYRLRVINPNGMYAGNQSGIWNLTGLQLEGVHDDGRVAVFQIPYMEFYDAQAIIGADNLEYQNSFRGELHLVSVDGYACGWPGVPRKMFFVQ